jgi:hypothetical protein
MVIEKAGMKLLPAIKNWIKATGKSSTIKARPQSLKGVNSPELKFASKLDKDVVQISKLDLRKTATEMDISDGGAFDYLLSIRPYIKSVKGDEYLQGMYKKMFVGRCWGRSPNERVNAYLRTGQIGNEPGALNRVNDIIDSTHYAMQNSKLPHDTMLHRGVKDLDFIPAKGETFTEKGFLSTSAKYLSTTGYGNKTITILAPKGTPCLADGQYYEILLKNGLDFKVIEKSDNYVILLCKGAKAQTSNEVKRIQNYADRVTLYPKEFEKEIAECW